MDALEGVLPEDAGQQNTILKRMIAILRKRLTEVSEELRRTREQLCRVCDAQSSAATSGTASVDSRGPPGPPMAPGGADAETVATYQKDLAAAIARAAALQADYDAIIAHFDSLRAGYKRLLVHSEAQRLDLDAARARAADLAQTSDQAESARSRVTELTLLLQALGEENKRLDAALAERTAGEAEAVAKFDALRDEASRKVDALTEEAHELKADVVRAAARQAQLEDEARACRRELQGVLELTATSDLAELARDFRETIREKDRLAADCAALAQRITAERGEHRALVARLRADHARDAERDAERWRTDEARRRDAEVAERVAREVAAASARGEDERRLARRREADLEDDLAKARGRLEDLRAQLGERDAALAGERQVVADLKRRFGARQKAAAADLERALTERDEVSARYNRAVDELARLRGDAGSIADENRELRACLQQARDAEDRYRRQYGQQGQPGPWLPPQAQAQGQVSAPAPSTAPLLPTPLQALLQEQLHQAGVSHASSSVGSVQLDGAPSVDLQPRLRLRGRLDASQPQAQAQASALLPGESPASVAALQPPAADDDAPAVRLPNESSPSGSLAPVSPPATFSFRVTKVSLSKESARSSLLEEIQGMFLVLTFWDLPPFVGEVAGGKRPADACELVCSDVQVEYTVFLAYYLLHKELTVQLVGHDKYEAPTLLGTCGVSLRKLAESGATTFALGLSLCNDDAAVVATAEISVALSEAVPRELLVRLKE